MKSKDAKVFLEALDELEREKGISKESLLLTVEQALLAAYKKNHGEEENVEVEINRETGDVKLYEVKTVVETEDLDDAQEIKKRAKVGDIVRIEINCEEFRRNAIQNGKQIVIQKVREAERQYIYDRFKEKENDIINGIIRRIDEKKNIFVEFDGIEAILPTTEQSPADTYRVGERLKVFLAEVEKTNKFPKIVISRKHEGLLKKLFELEIPEITSGLIEIKAVAREAGSRAKVAVYSSDPNIDTVGACIGQKGLRIKNIVNELNGEKISLLGASSVKLNEKEMMVIGGFNKEVYDNAVTNLSTLKGEELAEFKAGYFGADPAEFNWNREILIYNSDSNSWKTIGQVPFDAPCGEGLVLVGNKVFSINGEIKPGIRTDRMYGGTIIKK